MSERRFLPWALVLLAVCAPAPADPFAPATPAPEMEAPAFVPSPPVMQTPNYRVAGAVISGRRAVAAIQLPEGRFFIVRRGEKIGDATVAEITLDAVRLETSAGVLRLPVSD